MNSSPSIYRRLPFLSFSLLTAFAISAPSASRSPEPPADINVGGARIHVEFSGVPFDEKRALVLEWITRCAQAVSTYYGRFPISQLDLHVDSFPGEGVRHGVTRGLSPGRGQIRIRAGLETSKAGFLDDWELTHEMVHLAFPSVSQEHHWIEEGLATYVESWARFEAGILTREKVWGDFVRDMPQGEPKPGDQGLDHTPTWGRTYWGGALYCLVADVRLHEATQNKVGLKEALRAINKEGTVADSWELERVLKTGDTATGTRVLEDLFHEMKDKPDPIDLTELWEKLGIQTIDGKIRFDDNAPLATTRQAMERIR